MRKVTVISQHAAAAPASTRAGPRPGAWLARRLPALFATVGDNGRRAHERASAARYSSRIRRILPAASFAISVTSWWVSTCVASPVARLVTHEMLEHEQPS